MGSWTKPVFIVCIVVGTLLFAYGLFDLVTSASAATAEELDLGPPMFELFGGVGIAVLGILGLVARLLGGTVSLKKLGPDPRPAQARLVEVRSGNAREKHSMRRLMILTFDLEQDGVTRRCTTKQWVEFLSTADLVPGAVLGAYVSAKNNAKVWVET